MFSEKDYSDARPNVGVTVVPFVYDEGVIKVLIYKRSSGSEVFKDFLCLPNRFFNINDFNTMEEAANHALWEKAGVSFPAIIQFHTFSGSYIDPTRITTVNSCYYSILRKSEIVYHDTFCGFDTFWMDVRDVLKLELAFNHNEVLELAYKRLLASAEYTTDPILFLDKKFTINELRVLTEFLIKKPIDNSRFRDRIKKSGILIETNEKQLSGSNRPSQLFILNENLDGYFYPKSLTKST